MACLPMAETVLRRLTHGLFAHGALVRVARRLVVVWIRNQTSTDAKDRERLDLEVSRLTTTDVNNNINARIVSKTAHLPNVSSLNNRQNNIVLLLLLLLLLLLHLIFQDNLGKPAPER